MRNGWWVRMCVVSMPMSMCVTCFMLERMTPPRQRLVLFPIQLVLLRVSHRYVFPVSLSVPRSQRVTTLSLGLRSSPCVVYPGRNVRLLSSRSSLIPTRMWLVPPPRILPTPTSPSVLILIRRTRIRACSFARGAGRSERIVSCAWGGVVSGD